MSKVLNPGSKTLLRTFETDAYKKITKATSTLDTIMAIASCGSNTIATIHSEVGTASKVVTTLLALLPQP